MKGTKGCKQLLCSLFFCCLAVELFAQEQKWEELFNQMVEMEDEDVAWEVMYEELCDLEQNPVNLNVADKGDLERVPFLTDEQIEDILYYIYCYGPMKSKGELLFIESLDYFRRKLLYHFITIEEPKNERKKSFAEMVAKGKNTLTGELKVPLYEHEGDKNGYLGYGYKHSIRYEKSYGTRLKMGIVAAQDAGEPFFSYPNKMGYDYYSPYLLLKGDGLLETLAIGRYRWSVGMGLVSGNSFSLGKMAMVTSLGRSTTGIRAYTSRSEADYYQGSAAALRLSKSWKMTAFVSYRAWDATLNDDSTAATMITTGYHRTAGEIAKKNNMHEWSVGADIQWYTGKYWLGTTAMVSQLDRILQPNSAVAYRKFYPQGQNFFNMSLYYGHRTYLFELKGETAIDKNRALATVNSFSLAAGRNIRLLMVQRFYSYRYAALHAHGFGNNSKTQNESGLMVGMDWCFLPKWKCLAYADWAYYPWHRALARGNSYDFDCQANLIYEAKPWSLQTKYKAIMRQRNVENKPLPMNHWWHKWSARATMSVNDAWKWTIQTDVVRDASELSWGWMAHMVLERNWQNGLLNLSGGYFNTDDYNSRIYIYEKGLRYSFSYPMFYGEGIRYALMAKMEVLKNVQMTAKIGVSNYFDRSFIGSSLQMIKHSSKADVELQAQWKF